MSRAFERVKRLISQLFQGSIRSQSQQSWLSRMLFGAQPELSIEELLTAHFLRGGGPVFFQDEHGDVANEFYEVVGSKIVPVDHHLLVLRLDYREEIKQRRKEEEKAL
eukprot:TRINITY_DN5_c0_g1_i2.p1 TRINITY_DN5_c0_g1~~TRINITY_DN5_c0_g1_i2.p1  ORF type:complete len:126 (-),score=6.38 TRINITY_DN5_c0_g1_i2:42-365(-)